MPFSGSSQPTTSSPKSDHPAKLVAHIQGGIKPDREPQKATVDGSAPCSTSALSTRRPNAFAISRGRAATIGCIALLGGTVRIVSTAEDEFSALESVSVREVAAVRELMRSDRRHTITQLIHVR